MVGVLEPLEHFFLSSLPFLSSPGILKGEAAEGGHGGRLPAVHGQSTQKLAGVCVVHSLDW